jgi:hypothetical protein
MSLSTGKIAEVLFDKVLDTYEHQLQMLEMCDYFAPDSGDMQNASNFVWRPVQQHAPIIEGWDLSSQETGIIEETYPAILGVPKNDLIEQRADDLRDMRFWERRGEQSGKRQATELNRLIAAQIANTGTLFYRSNTTSGYEFIAQAQAILNERETPSDDERYFMLNDRATLKFGSDLAARQTLQGRAEETWKTGQIGQNVAEFDVYTGPFLPNLTGGADPATTLSATVSEKPEGGSVVAATGVVTNVDYRTMDVAVVASASYNVGDRVTVGDVKSIGLADKVATNQLMTFTVVAKPDGTTLTLWPKAIAANDAALSTLEKAYANVDHQLTSADEVNRLNTGASEKTNIFWCKNSIEVTGGDAPLQLLNEFGGMKVISSTMSNGQKMYMAYDGNIDKLTFKCRLFTWYGITNKNPSANGVGISY